jgi:hypothetical protein
MFSLVTGPMVFVGSLVTVVYLVSSQLNSQQAAQIYTITDCCLVACCTWILYHQYSKFKAKVKLIKRRERIYMECLRARPPTAFAPSEFKNLYERWGCYTNDHPTLIHSLSLIHSPLPHRRWAQQGREAILVDAVLDAADWCFADPRKHW